MKKLVRQITGTSIGVTFTKEDKELYGIKIGSILDMSDVVVTDEGLKNCAVCGKKKLLMHIHHIDKNHSNNDNKNLLDVCQGCHRLIHSKKIVKTGVKFKGNYPEAKFVKKLNFYKTEMRIKMKKKKRNGGKK